MYIYIYIARVSASTLHRVKSVMHGNGIFACRISKSSAGTPRVNSRELRDGETETRFARTSQLAKNEAWRLPNELSAVVAMTSPSYLKYCTRDRWNRHIYIDTFSPIDFRRSDDELWLFFSSGFRPINALVWSVHLSMKISILACNMIVAILPIRSVMVGLRTYEIMSLRN